MVKLNDATRIYIGNTPASKVMLGDTQVWPADNEAPSSPLVTIGAIPYFYPDHQNPNGLWNDMFNAAPTVSVLIANAPSGGASGGPGEAYVAHWGAAIANAQAAGIKVLGYVDTSYANTAPDWTTGLPVDRSLPTVKAELDLWYDFYNVDGIFFDQTTTGWQGGQEAADYLAYYTDLSDYVRSTKPIGHQEVVFNPGVAPTDVGYLDICDRIMIAEGNHTDYISRTPATYEASYPRSKFWHVIHSTPRSELDGLLDIIAEQQVGVVTITDRLMPMPYYDLGTYWNDFVAGVEAIT